MMKKVWLILSAVVLVFGLAVLGCSSGGGGGDPVVPEPGAVLFKLEIADNFLYGDGYQGIISDILNVKKNYTGKIDGKIEAGQTYAMRIKFTASRPLENKVQVGLVDTVTKYWTPLSWDGDDETTAIFIEQENVDGATAEEPCVAIIEFTILTSAASDGGGENSLVFQTKGDGNKGTAGSGVKGPVTFTFYEFVFIKGTKDDLPEESKPITPEPPGGDFDINALAGIKLSAKGTATYDEDTKVASIENSSNALVWFTFEDAGYTFNVSDTLKINYACILDAAAEDAEGPPEILPFSIKSGADSYDDIAAENYNNGIALEGTESGSFTVDMYRLRTGKQNGISLQYNPWYGGAGIKATESRVKILSVEKVTPASPFRVHFVNQKTDGSYTKLSEVDGGVATGSKVTEPAADAAWLTAILGEGKRLDGWKVLGTNADWVFATSTVTTNIALYPVITLVPSVTTVTVAPATPTVLKGGTQQFTATVTGTNSPATTVTWSIVETGLASGTNITTAGLLTVAGDEAKTTLTVKATSTVDTTKSGTATVTVTAVAPTVTSVTVAPTTATVVNGGSKTFAATVNGTNSPSQDVTWSIDTADVATGTTITAAGKLTISTLETKTSITVKATSVADTTKSGTAAVTVEPFVKGLTGFTSIVKELTTFADTSTNFRQWVFTAEEMAEADYLVFTTDGSLVNANKDGFGGTQVGLQNNSGSYGMSDDKITTKGWSPFSERAGICMFAIDLSKLPDYTQDSGGYKGVTTGALRIYLGYWPKIEQLAADGYVALVKGNLVKPAAGAEDVVDSAETPNVVGFITKVE